MRSLVVFVISLSLATWLILIFTMFDGRLGAITIMNSLLGQDKKQKLVEYPKESILVG